MAPNPLLKHLDPKLITFKHNCTEGMVTTGTHTTPVQRYVDDMTFTFTQEADYCSVDVRIVL